MARKVTTGLAESKGSLMPDLQLISNITCGLTAQTRLSSEHRVPSTRLPYLTWGYY